ncbi:MAG: thioredoxin domain-containing protein [Gammaproteobacteria bacterium]|nr:thioredoxin domain-containing protein [Gammaproteobacteria bacterium]
MAPEQHYTHPYTNRLIDETSPYLQQHAHNPVDWYPWGKEAIEKARQEDKPILLSIGYSACHWCHVMEHESFEHPEVAEVMNALFINIKVDREERPDLDKIYQLAHQMLTQRGGGWPLNMFLTPEDHTPFFGGTYFPRQARHGMPPFVELMRKVDNYYRKQRQDIDKQNTSVREAFKHIRASYDNATANLDADILQRAMDGLWQQFDGRYGGFGQAPKFPHPTNLERCLHHWHNDPPTGDTQRALHMARTTLHAMAKGGLYDQLGGGFCRYSVDERWMIPHFEKMLYDNGPLQTLYTDAYMAAGETTFKNTAIGIGEWVLREMQSPQGGYYSTLDADSEGEEGKFYAWESDEIRSLLDKNEWPVIEARYRLKGKPNFEGKWHLHVQQGVDQIAKAQNLSSDNAHLLIDSAHKKLFAARQNRIHPGRDEKILTSWNGLMIKGMARTGRFLDRPDFIASAQQAMDFIQTTLWQGGRLLATHKDGRTHLNAYLDDYVFVIDACLELLQAQWRRQDLDFAIELIDCLFDHFEDREHGGFFFTSDDHEVLIHRYKPAADDATPSGNGVAAQVLLKFGHLLGEARYLDAAEHTIKSLYPEMDQYPHAFGSLLNAMEIYLQPPQTLVLRGNTPAMSDWVLHCTQSYAPNRVVVAIPDDNTDLPGILEERKPADQVIAYLCSGHSCQAPLTDIHQLKTALG